MFKLFSDKIISNVLNKNSNAYDILAIRNKSLNDLDKKNVSFRWHMDSFFSQLKTFLFISERTFTALFNKSVLSKVTIPIVIFFIYSFF